MKKYKNKAHEGWPIVFVILGLIDLTVLLAILLRGHDIALLHPKGFIAQEQFKLIVISAAVLLGVAVPSVLLFYYMAWKYRETNEKASYEPEKRHGKGLLIAIWGVPTAVMVVMGLIMWSSTHRLDPHTPLVSSSRPLTVQVIAMRWKWLFIYPEQNIATVNFVEIPTGTPVKFELTADEVPMSSFWVPHLGGQLYAMTGMVNDLNLTADTPGTYDGSSAEINGDGFAGMKFTAKADPSAVFNGWVADVQRSGTALDSAEYAKLLKPSENNPQVSYSRTTPGLYDGVVMKYMKTPDTNMADMEH